jgi:uncharacterized protein YggE
MKWLVLSLPLTAVLSVFLFLAVIQVIPIEWGSVSLKPARTVTVYGTSQLERANEIASFTAGVNEVDENKEVAINRVNETVNKILSDVKTFGIAEEDIKTQNISINRIDDAYNLSSNNTSVRWAANNSVEITLRDIGKASALADLLAASGATNVYGPNFRLDEASQTEPELLKSAIEDAREKAQGVAQQTGSDLGKMLTVDESLSQQNPLYMLRSDMGGGGGAPTQPGTSTVSKTVMVVFELK